MLKKHFVWGSPLMSLGLIVLPAAASALAANFNGFMQSPNIEDRRFDAPGTDYPQGPAFQPAVPDPNNSLARDAGYWDIGSPSSMQQPSQPSVDQGPTASPPADPSCSLSTDCRADPGATPQSATSPSCSSCSSSTCSGATCSGSAVASNCSGGCGAGCGVCGGCGG